MKVVSNTSPICYLLLIDQVHLLPIFWGEIVIPTAVRDELEDKAAPAKVREWIKQPPAWLKVQSVSVGLDPALKRLHPGEQEAIWLAHALQARLVLLDEKEARQVALERGLKVAGLVGILDQAATRGMVDLPAAIDRLRQTNFRASPRLLKALLDRH